MACSLGPEAGGQRGAASRPRRRRTKLFPAQESASSNLKHQHQAQTTIPSLALHLALWAQLLLPILAFNLDTQTPLVHSGPQNSYFGYSVAQHRDRGSNWLLVGAPRAQTDQARTKDAGAVYRCAPSTTKACQQIPFDPNGSSSISLRDQVVQSDEKAHQYFGASLASASDNGSIVACAPKYVYYSTNLKRRDPVGTCWVSRGSFSGFLEYSPCRLNGKCWRQEKARTKNDSSQQQVAANFCFKTKQNNNNNNNNRTMGTPPSRLVSGRLLERHNEGK